MLTEWAQDREFAKMVERCAHMRNHVAEKRQRIKARCSTLKNHLDKSKFKHWMREMRLMRKKWGLEEEMAGWRSNDAEIRANVTARVELEQMADYIKRLKADIQKTKEKKAKVGAKNNKKK